MFETLERRQPGLARHPVYQLLRTPEAVRVPMQQHVCAVWDFMSLLKAMQQRMTGVTRPSRRAPTADSAGTGRGGGFAQRSCAPARCPLPP